MKVVIIESFNGANWPNTLRKDKIMESITKSNPQFDVIRWLALAASKDKLKPSLRTINVRDDKAVATDGHVLNQYNYKNGDHQLFGLPPGLYEIIKVNKTEVQLVLSDGHFPDTDSVWPDLEAYKEVGLSGCSLGGYQADIDLSKDFCRVVRAMKDEGGINFNLFKIAAEGAEMTKAYVNPESGQTATVLKNGARESLVMPIRM